MRRRYCAIERFERSGVPASYRAHKGRSALHADLRNLCLLRDIHNARTLA